MAIFQSSLLLLLIVALFGPAGHVVRPAYALQGMGMAPAPARRLEHIDLNARMVKKRAPVARPPIDKRQTTAPAATDTGNTVVADPTTLPAPSVTPTDAPNTTNGGQQTSDCGLLGLGCLFGPGDTSTTPGTSTTNTRTTATSRSSTSSASTSSATSQATVSRTVNTRTAIATVTDSARPQTSDQSKDKNASFLSKPVIIGLIVTASCVVAGAAIWTIIRKWKFSPSRHFEDRLEPINWEPTQPSGLPHDPTVAALARGAGKGRNGSIGSNEDGGRNMTTAHDQPISMAPDFPPAHDFTAGPAGPTATGYHGGYVDMQRGPSPNPGAAAYGRYDAPNPYDAYDYNAGYGQQRRY